MKSGRNLFVGIALAGTALGFAPSAAIASEIAQAQPQRGQDVQERQEQREQSEDFAPIGMRVGSFQLFPAIEVDGEFGDNIFATQEGEQSDFFTRIRPEVELNSDWNNHALNFRGEGEVIRYYRFDDDDVENYSVSTDGRIDVRRSFNINFGAGYAIGHEDRGDPNAVTSALAPTETETTDANIGFAYNPNRISISVDFEFQGQDFEDATNRDSTITNNDDRDREKSEIIGRVGYEYLPDTEAFVTAAFNQIEYDITTDDNGEQRSSDGYSIVVGTDLAFTGVVTGNVFAGVISQSYDDGQLEDIDGPTVGASVNWDATPLITVRGSLSRSVQETTTSGSPGFMSTVASISADYEILRPLTASASGKWTYDDYESIARDDDTFEVEVGAKYLFSRNLSLNGTQTFKRKISSNAGSSYTQNTTLLTLRGQF